MAWLGCAEHVAAGCVRSSPIILGTATRSGASTITNAKRANRDGGAPIASPFASQLPYGPESPSLGQESLGERGLRDTQVYARVYHRDGPSQQAEESERPQVAVGDGSDWSAYLQHAQYVDSSAITGDPQIDRNTKLLVDVLAESAKTMGQAVPPEMRANVFGIHVHHDFATRVKALDLPGIGPDGVEQSWSLGALMDYGVADSIRTDIYLRNRLGQPIAIYDLKTGNARLTAKRRKELRDAVGGGDDIPVIELRFVDLTALQR